MTAKESAWRVMRDPARPQWPGLLVVGPGDAFVQVVAGAPHNCSDSAALADRITDALNAGGGE